MTKVFNHLTLLILSASMISTNSFANNIDIAHGNTPVINSVVGDDSDEHHSIRFGFEGGVSEPIVKSFNDKTTKTKISLKRSPTVTGLIGYEFATGMYLELSAAHHKKFRVGIKLPDNNGTGNTKALANIYMLSLNYDLPALKIANTVTPYIVLGAGMAQVKIKQLELLSPKSPNFKIVSLQTLQKTSNSFAWQVGLGGNVKLSDNLTVNASAKMQVINNVKMHYISNENDASSYYKKMSDPKKIKKTLGIGVFSLGLNYSFPISS